MDRRTAFGTLCATVLAGGISSVLAIVSADSRSPFASTLFYGGIAGILLGITGFIALFVPKRTLEVTTSNPGNVDVQNVISHNQSGGITAHTINIDRRTKRQLTTEMKAGLLSGLKDGKPISVLGLNGDSESCSFANEIHSFLRSHGLPVVGSSATWHMFFNPPVFTVDVKPYNNGTEWHIVVGPAQ